VTRYRCVAARKAEGFNVTAACRAAGVSRSAFYAWHERPEGPTDAEWDEALLINEIVDIHRRLVRHLR
jgi:putative transposase